MCFLDSVYKTFIISTIVDSLNDVHNIYVYKTFIISTIVDQVSRSDAPRRSIRHL